MNVTLQDWYTRYGDRLAACKALLGDRYLLAVPVKRTEVVAHMYERIPESLVQDSQQGDCKR